jgi:glucose/arabinose dehydrogenase
LVTGVQIPWEILWGPDNQLWVTSRKGEVLRIDPASGNYTSVLDMSVMNGGNGEPGMLGMAMHPDWESTPLVYIVYCTGSGGNGVEHLSSFEWNGDALVNEEEILSIQAGGIHNGSRLLMLPDNTLLMTTGDVGSSSYSQNMNSLQGKTLRLNLDGSVPADNPFPNSLVYTFGNRNSQGLALGPNGIIYSSEHGQNSNDEFNIVTAGGNYGWPNVEGFCNTSSEQSFCAENDVIEPLEAWSPCIAVNGIEFYNHEAIPEWQNSVLMSVLGGLGGQYERLSVLHLDEDGQSVISEDQYFSSLNQRVRDVAVNPNTGAVYVALNGTSYPGSGPNIIKEFRNEAYGLDGITPWGGSDFDLDLFPNPSSEMLKLKMPDGVKGTFQITGYNGQLMVEGDIDEPVLVVPVSSWSPGAYFIQIRHQAGIITRTFQVQR